VNYEGALIEPSPQVIQTIAELKGRGFTLAIDDFGTGYSSLAYLQRFNVDKLKIDRSFVKDVLTDSQGEAIISAIILMAKSLNLKIKRSWRY
jgi:EAL domain-containing protein (putative c-di-GMP-specific phosphodiesterase class I)